MSHHEELVDMAVRGVVAAVAAVVILGGSQKHLHDREIFADGFETGTPAAWSRVVGYQAPPSIWDECCVAVSVPWHPNVAVRRQRQRGPVCDAFDQHNRPVEVRWVAGPGETPTTTFERLPRRWATLHCGDE